MSKRSLSTKVLTVFLLAALLAACSSQASIASPSASLQLDATTRTQATAFVPDPGLADAAILFRTLGAAGTLFFGRHEVVFPLPSQTQSSVWFSRLLGTSPSDSAPSAQPAAVRLQFVGADPDTRVVGQEQLPGVVNYFLGNDPAKWKTNVPTFGRLAYEELYPGIDLVYNGGDGVLKGTYLVAPGANPGNILWRYEGASRVELSKDELLIGVGEAGQEPLFVERRPVAWQTVAGKRTPVKVQYVVHDDGSIGFALGRYDAAQPLVIDPTLEYGTYWGFSGCDGAYHIALDSNNNVYITGTTNSQGYPQANANCDQTQYFDVFITKLDPSKTGANQHVYTTYIGGSSYDIAIGIGVDAAGNAYAAGFTESNNLPTTPNAYQQNFKDGMVDGMVIQLNTTGAVQYLSYLGGTNFEELMQVAVGNSPLVYVVGFTDSSDFPTTANAYASTLQGRDAFVSVLDTSKSGAASLVYSTFYGDSGYDEGYAIAVANGIIYFAGTTTSTNLPLKNAVQTNNGGGSGYGDVFAAQLDPSLSGTNQLLFATYLGGSNDEIPGGVVPSGTGYMYVTGVTGSNFPTTSVSPAFGGGAGDEDAFLAKLDVAAPTSLFYSRFVGGNHKDGLRDVVIDSQDNAYVAGYTGSDNFQTVNPLQAIFKGGAAISGDSGWLTSRGASDAMLAKFDPTGTMIFGTYLGGTGADGAMGIRLGTDGKVYVAGSTRSTDFNTANAYQTSNAGTYDAFIVGIGGLTSAPVNWLYLPLVLR